ncbi:MAG: M13 family metallopeptidase [Sphingomonas sp.]
MTLRIVSVLVAAASLAGLAAAQQAPVHPQFGSFGFDEAGMDRSVAPGDDFYGFANGTWQKTTAIPADKPGYGVANLLADLSEARTRDILEEAARDPASKIGTAYATYLDRAAIDAKGLTPVRPWLARIKGLRSRAAYPALLVEAWRAGVGRPFSGGVSPDERRPEVYAFHLSQSGLGLPDRDYYLSADPKLAQVKAAYQAHIAKMLTLAGEAGAERRAKALVAFETAIARVSWSRVQNRDAVKTYNRMTVARLARSAPGLDFRALLNGLGIKAGSVIVFQPDAVAAIARLIAAAPLAVLRDQLLARTLDGFADVLPHAFDDEAFAFSGTILSGTPQQQARWKRAVQFTSGALDDDISRIYVARYFPPETKAAADTLVANLIAAMGRRIDALAWMSPETKAKAHAKLAALHPKIGYPERWKDLSTLTIARGDAFGNKWRANRWRLRDNIAHLGKPLQRWEWGMTPMTVNAYAEFSQVEIVFPAAILQPPFFDPAADPAVNYGGIGAVIGHEMSHHFDDQGAKYDMDGRLTDWWQALDVERFRALAKPIVAQYDAYEPLPGMHVKGELTLGENIADLAGLTVAYDAYHAALGGQPAPVIDGFTGDQRFFLGWAQIWRRVYREALARQRLLTDPHAPAEQRAAIVRNLDSWYAAFGAKPADKLYLAPEARLRIW